MRRLLTMDHHLAGSDFIGQVHVVDLAEGAEEGSAHIELEVRDAWHAAPGVESHFTLQVPHFAEVSHLVEKGADLVVLLSGVAGGHGRLTFGANSVFVVGDEGSLRCTSGNPLFAVHNSGFVCSVQSYMPGAPASLAAMRADTVAMRRRAADRLPDIAGAGGVGAPKRAGKENVQ